MYPVVFFDALRVKIREDAVVRNKAVYLAQGILPDGTRDILGLRIENAEGAKFLMAAWRNTSRLIGAAQPRTGRQQ
ncbi:transposase mutator type [Pandoraea sp. SD6-2]|nr:transposase mutator type [Pandoraea sp. SD6-2]